MTEFYIFGGFVVVALAYFIYQRSKRKKRPEFGDYPYDPENDPLAKIAKLVKKLRG